MKLALSTSLLVISSAFVPLSAQDFAHPDLLKKIAPKPERLSMVPVWDVAKFASEPDLVRYDSRWLVAFREASSATATDGSIRLMSSLDGTKWSQCARLDHPIADLNMPRLQTMPDGKLLLTAAVTMHADGPSKYRTYGWKSTDGSKWEGPEAIGDAGISLGPIEWRRGKAYSFGFQPGARERTLRGYSSDTMLEMSPTGAATLDSAQLGTTGITFLPDDTGIAVAEHTDGSLRFGLSRPPYKHWSWKSLEQSVKDPRLTRLDDGRLLVSGADGKGRASLYWLDPFQASLKQAGALSAADTKEGAGIRWYDGALWTVYQAPTPNGAPGIYMARIKLP